MQKCIILGQSLTSKLQTIDHPIANFILKCAEEKEQLDVDFSYFDFVNDEGKISFLKSRWEGDGQEFVSSRRETMKIGRLVIALSQKKNTTFADKDIEDFVNKYKIFQQDSHFEIFKGKVISKWYNEEQYDRTGESGASLYNSCMRHKNCKSFFSIYEKHPKVSLLCLLNSDKKLQGRAILWEDIELNGKKITFLDRIYTYKYSAEAIFKDHAIKNGWWFKLKQSNASITITDGKEELNTFELKVNLPTDIKWDNIAKPYMDTLRYVREDVVDGDIIEYLSSNGDDQNYKQYWTQTSGGHNVNHSYLSIKDSSTALYNHFKAPVTIIGTKLMVCNDNKYRVENNHTIRRFVSEKFLEDKHRFINIDSVDKYIEYINVSSIMAHEDAPKIILKNIDKVSSLNDNILNYLEPEIKYEYITTFLKKNIKYLKNFKNLSLNKLRILPSLRDSIIANGWPERMNNLIGEVYTYDFERYGEYRIYTPDNNWSIPAKDVEVMKLDIDFTATDDKIIEQISKIFADGTIGITNIMKSVNNFKLGDKVICINRNSNFYNVEGVIKDLLEREREPRYGVAYKENRGGHNLNASGRAKTRSGYGYYMYATELRLLDTYVDNDYKKYFNLLSDENKIKYIKDEIIHNLRFDDIRKFDKESQLQMIHIDIKYLPDRFENSEIQEVIKTMTEYEIINSNAFYFIKEKNS